MAPDHISYIFDSIYQNYFSVGAVVPFAFTLSLSVILLRVPEKSRATLHLGLVYLLLSVFFLGYIIAAMLYHPVAAYHRWITAGIVTLIETHFIIFVFYYLEETNITFAKRLGAFLYTASISLTIFFIFITFESKRVYHFEGHYWDFDADRASIAVAILILTYLVIMLAIGIYKIAVSRSKSRIYLLSIILIVFILISIPAAMNLLSRLGFLDRGTYQITQDMLTILGFFALFVIYMNTTRDQTSLMTKFMSIVLAASLIAFQGLSYISLSHLDKTYDEYRRQQLPLVIKAGSHTSEIAYLIKLDPGGFIPAIITNSTGSAHPVDLQSARNGLFNTAQYERIARLEGLDPRRTEEQMNLILDTNTLCFRGYRDTIQSLMKRLPPGRNASKQIISHIRALQWRVRYYSKKISTMPDDGFKNHLENYLQRVHPEMAPFKEAMRTLAGDGHVSEAALKRDVLHVLSPMSPEGTRLYREGRGSSQHFTSYVFYDEQSRTAYEAGFDYRKYREYQHPMSMKFIFILAIILVLMLGAFQFFFLGIFVRPVKRLLQAIKEVRAGNDDIVISVTVHDELGSISHSFNEMTGTLRMSKDVMSDYAENLEKMVQERTEELKKARDALWSEMELARKMQTILIPLEPAIPGYEITGYMMPAEMVGGDYYDIINADGFDWVVIGDVSGHGVPAGIIMMMVQTSIHTVLAGKPGIRPSALLDQINGVITDNIKKLNEEKFMTITAMACMSDGVFSASGMHQDILVYRAAKDMIEAIPTCGIILGLKDTIDYPAGEMEIRLEPGDIMLLYTDGITESWRKDSVRNHRDPDTEMFGLGRLQETFFRNRTGSPDAIRDAILKALDGYRLSDDVSMVVIKRK